MDFMSDGVARGHIIFALRQGPVACRETFQLGEPRPKLDSLFSHNFRARRFSVVPALFSGSWLRRSLLFWHSSPRRHEPAKKFKKRLLLISYFCSRA